MVFDSVHYIRGDTAVKIVESVERAIRSGKLHSGQRLPPVRSLADTLGVSPSTVAAAYQALQSRGMVICQGRRGTKVSHLPIAGVRAHVPVPSGARNLFDGNPDPELLPALGPALREIDTSSRLYGQVSCHTGLLNHVARDFARDGVAKGEIAFVNGAMDGMERVLGEWLRPGDRVAVEDPMFGNILDLVMSRGLSLVPVAVDEEGMLPDQLRQACGEGINALIVTPRAQNPTGAAITAQRSKALRGVLRRHPDLLVIEDDHAAQICNLPLHPLHTAQRHWAYIRSFSKGLNPDLRLAAITGDVTTMTRVQDRMVVGERWVSHILQRVAFSLLSSSTVRAHLRRAAATYAKRRGALVDALRSVGFQAMGASGYNVWVPVAEETATVQAMMEAGWAVRAGERFRIDSPPAIRITAATLEPIDARRLARDLAAVMSRALRTAVV